MNSRTSFLQEVKLSGSYFFASIAFFCSLQYSFIHFLVPVFSYAGFTLDVDRTKYLESWLILLLLLLMAPKRFYKASDFLVNHIIFFYLIPILVLYGLSNESRVHLYVILICVFLVDAIRRGRPLQIPIVKGGKYISYMILVSGSALVTSWMILASGFGAMNFNMSAVYDFRDVQSSALNVGLMSYLNVWATKLFGPILLALCLSVKRYLWAAFIVILQVFWFSMTTHRSVLFYPILVLFVWAVFQKGRGFSVIPTALLCLVLFSNLIYLYSGDIIISSLVIRRALFVPASLTFDYYTFFSQNSFIFWSNSLTSKFIEYPYYVSPPQLIGMYTGSGSNANNSFIATGYMHAGALGVVLYGFLVGLLFRFLDSLSFKGTPSWIALSAVLVPAHSLITSADLPTAILTHGFGVSLIILFLLRSSDTKSFPEGAHWKTYSLASTRGFT